MCADGRAAPHAAARARASPHAAGALTQEMASHGCSPAAARTTSRNRVEEEDTFSQKKMDFWTRSAVHTHTHFSDFDCRAHVSSSEPWSARLNLSPKSSTMHPNMCDHACMRAHACTHACTRRMRRVVCSVSRYTRSLHGSSFWAPADSAECMLNQVRGLISSINKITHSLSRQRIGATTHPRQRETAASTVSTPSRTRLE